ncbi:MAG TPA: hypothetical protein PKM72_05425 [Nitrospirales bacterium]|nr:hypothetical protein [Nitrospirales bacterium]
MKKKAKRMGSGIRSTQGQKPLWNCLVGTVASLWLMGFSGLGDSRPLLSSVYPVSNIPSLHPDDSENTHQGFAPSIQTLVVTPDGVVYAGSFGMGLFRSQDKGKSWDALNRGLTDPFLLCLTVTPGKHIYAGTMRGGVYRLGLKGTTWESIGTGLHEAEVKSFLVHGDAVYAGTGTGVYRWVEAEKQWVIVGAGLDRILVPGLAIMDDGKLFAATSGKGLFHLETQQSSPAKWVDSQSIFVDPRERLPHRYLRVIAVNEAQHIFLGTQDGGIFRSTDRGQSWLSLSRNLPNDSIRSIVPDHEDIIVATGNGIFRWKTDQQQWVGMNTGLTNLAIQSLTLSDAGELYAGTSSGAFRSQDGGAHWTNISQGLGVQLVPKGPYE